MGADFYRTATITLSLTGTTGEATSDISLDGEIVSIVAQHDHGGGTLDLTFTEIGNTVRPDQTLTVLSNGAKGPVVPAIQAVDAAGAVIAGVYMPRYVAGYIKMAAAQGTNGDDITAWVTVRRS